MESDMSGIIELIEAEGQREVCTKSILPRYLNEAARTSSADALTAIGVTVGPPVDDLFFAVTLPDGWAVTPVGNHNMWSELRDAFGRKRAGIFYKAAPYDRRASIYFTEDKP